MPALRGAALAGLLEDALTDTGGAGFCKGQLSRLEAMSCRCRRADRRGDRNLRIRHARGFPWRFLPRTRRLPGGLRHTQLRRRHQLHCASHNPEESGLVLDAVLIGESDLAILFSYTRAYFRVAAPSPYELVQWLRQLMPGKRVADLYNAVGFNRHAKTEFYRDFVRHLENSRDRFIPAEGARGMVMLVFTLPSYDVVFKLIRDRFDAPKNIDRADVMRRYRMVFEHDPCRAPGRSA